jgi:hydroxymethylpyrimidine/phosphomethylpyrimidine kinase
MDRAPTPPIVLTVAGSDSGGGAGIQADIKTFQAFGAFGTSVVTAITAQNTLGVHAVHPVPLPVVAAQLDAVLSDLRPAAVKTGMLATVGLVEMVADRLAAAAIPSVVVDPVMVATSGDRLLEEAAEETIRARLLPVASLVTPNIPEARILSGLSIRDPDEMLAAAKAIADAGAGAVLIKGGHMEADRLVDVLWDGASDTTWSREKIHTRNTHGTGCTLSAAIAAGLGFGLEMKEAVARGLDFVERAIRTAPDLGSGHGPLNHLVPPRPEA